MVHTAENSYRVSIPFFFEPNYDALIAPLPSCVSDQNPAKYGSVKYGDHLLSKVSRNFDFNFNKAG